jgi:hypothetical protein
MNERSFIIMSVTPRGDAHVNLHPAGEIVTINLGNHSDILFHNRDHAAAWLRGALEQVEALEAADFVKVAGPDE